MTSFLRAILVTGVLAGSAAAAPITFDLHNVTFTDGTSATGSFQYDPTTNAYSNVNITTSAGGYFPTFTFNSSDSSAGTVYGTSQLSVISNASFPAPYGVPTESLVLRLDFTSALTATSTSVGIATGTNSYECLDCAPYRGVASGTVSAVSSSAVTPEPSGLALLGTGILGMAGVVRRRLM